MVLSLCVRLCSVPDVTYLLAKSYVGLEDLVHPEAVTGALNCLKVLDFTRAMLTLTETCGQNVQILITAKGLKRLIKQGTTFSERDRLEMKYGLRYSSLLQLPYYDAIRMSSVIDPLHNLYLGTAKHIFENLWLAKGLLTHQTLESVQSRVTSIICPEDTGRIPSNITSNFGGFTGNQWKNWTELFSLIVLRGELTGEDLECWRHFVLASRLLSRASLTNSELLMADALLLQFCRRCVRLYGDEIATPNMHLHAHIRECIEAMVQRPYFGCLLLNEQPQPRGPDHATFHPRKQSF